MRYNSTLLVVADMARARHFYCALLGLRVTADFGANVTLSDAVSLQTLKSWREFINRPDEDIRFGHNAAELYFEEDDLDDFLQRLAVWPDLRYVHPLMTHRWGQRVVRFYDPDGHIVEVGENMTAVVRCFLADGMTVAQVAKCMEVPEDYILSHKGDAV